MIAGLRGLVRRYVDSYRGIPAPVWLVVAAAFVNASGGMVVRFLALYLDDRMALDVTHIGQAVAWFGAGSAFGGYITSVLCDKVRPSRILVVSLLVNGLSFIALAFQEDFGLILATLVIAGLFDGAFRPGFMFAVARLCPPDDRRRCYGLYLVALNLGLALGAVAGGWLATVDYKLIFWVDGATCILAAGWLAAARIERFMRWQGEADDARHLALAPFRDRHYLVFLLFLVLIVAVYFQNEAAHPIYLRQHYGLDPAAYGTIFAIYCALVVLVQVPLLDALKGVDNYRVAAGGIVVFTLGFALLPASTHPAVPYGLIVLTALGTVTAFPACVNIVMDRGERRGGAGHYMALYLTVFAVVDVAAPWGGGAIYDRLGGTALWLICGGLGAVAAVGIYRLRASAAPDMSRSEWKTL